MTIGDYIVLGVITAFLTVAIIYVVRQKRNGVKCVGCPHAKKCCSCNGCGINSLFDSEKK